VRDLCVKQYKGAPMSIPCCILSALCCRIQLERANSRSNFKALPRSTTLSLPNHVIFSVLSGFMVTPSPSRSNKMREAHERQRLTLRRKTFVFRPWPPKRVFATANRERDHTLDLCPIASTRRTTSSGPLS